MLNRDAMMRFAERFDEIFKGPQLDLIDELYGPEIDREGMKSYIGGFYVGLSDLRQHIDEVIIGEDRLVLRVTYTGTHDGPLFGVPATGRSVKVDGIGTFRFKADGKVDESYAVVDIAGLMAQIGALPVA